VGVIPYRRELQRNFFGHICQQCVLWRYVKSSKALYSHWLSGFSRCCACRRVGLRCRVYGHCAAGCRGPSQPYRCLRQSDAEKHLFVMPGLFTFSQTDNSTRGAATANSSIGSRGGFAWAKPLLHRQNEQDSAAKPYSNMHVLSDDLVFGRGTKCAAARHSRDPWVRMKLFRFGNGCTPDALLSTEPARNRLDLLNTRSKVSNLPFLYPRTRVRVTAIT